MTALDTSSGPARQEASGDGRGSSATSSPRLSALALLVLGNTVSMTGNVIMTVASRGWC